MVDLNESELHDALTAATRLAGLSPNGARIIHHYSNVVYALPDENAVARMTPESRSPQILELTQQVTGWLVREQGYGATEPLSGTVPVLVHAGGAGVGVGLTVSFWRYYPQPENAPAADSADLGRLLRELHVMPTLPPVDLPRWRPLTSLRNALTAETDYDGLTASERSWLLEQVEAVADQVEAFDWPLGVGMIHGDAWAGNLLWDTLTTPAPSLTPGPPTFLPRPMLGDWDGVSLGPREVDLIPTWHAAIRYGRDRSWTERFVEAYGYDLASSPGFNLLTRMRDLVQISGPLRRASRSPAHRAALRQRFEAIREGDLTMTWVGL